MSKRSGHYCWMCGRMRPNEAFSGKGHSQHLCKQCVRSRRAERKRAQTTQSKGENDRVEQEVGPRYFHDDGTEFNPGLLPVPDLCVSCVSHGALDADDEVLCNLTRADQQDGEVFVCFAYRPLSADIDREEVLRKLCKQAGAEYVEDPADDWCDIPF